MLALLWEARIGNVQPKLHVNAMCIVLLERLRADSTLVTKEADGSQKEWDFARENTASHYVSMVLGETQQLTNVWIAVKLQGMLLCCQPACRFKIHDGSYRGATVDLSSAHAQVMMPT